MQSAAAAPAKPTAAPSEDPGPALDRRPVLRWLLAFGACLLATLAVFGPALRADFLNFDDDRTILHPRSVDLATGVSAPAFDSDPVATHGRILDPDRAIAEVWAPVTQLSLYFDWWVSGRRLTYAGRTFRRPTPLWPHLHNLLLHALAGSLLALLLLELGLSLPLALLATLPFLLHPAQAEVVAWVSSRKDLLAVVFSLLALRHGCRVVAGKASAWPVWAFTALAVASKGSALVLPLVAPLLWLLPGPAERGPEGRRARFLLCWLPMVGLCGLAFLQQARLAQAFGTAAAGDVAVVPGTMLHYLGTLVWPTGLAVHHPLDLRPALAADALAKAAWLAVPLVGAVLLLLRGARPARLAGAGVLFVVLALLPFNGWLPATSVAAADRYLYLPMLGTALLLAGLLSLVPRTRLVPVAAGAAAVLALALGLPAHDRGLDFADSERLWKASLAVHPGDAVALYNLADVHLSRAEELGEGRTAEIEEGLRLLAEAAPRAVRPEHAVRVHEARFLWLRRLGRLKEALPEAEARLEAVRRLPGGGGPLALAAGVDLVELALLAAEPERAREVLAELRARHGDAAALLALDAWLALSRGGRARSDRPGRPWRRPSRAASPVPSSCSPRPGWPSSRTAASTPHACSRPSSTSSTRTHATSSSSRRPR
ncbi:MAG: hypothetical protein R3F30_11050 [Planctomycetota bacterium]